MTRLSDLLLGTDPVQRARLAQAGLAMLLLGLGVAAMHYFVWVRIASPVAVGWWAGVTLGGMLGFFAVLRSGWSRRWRDPSLSVPQLLFALASAAVAYALLGAGRGAVFPIAMVVLMFGMFAASPAQMRWIGAYTVLVFGISMGLMAWRDPAVYVPAIELGHFLLVATMVPAVGVLASRLARIRHRSRVQRTDLAQALARVREHTTRDELTGLINRRHVQTLMEQEHQRCIRSGQSFCLAMFDIDGFKPINTEHGYAVGDAVLRAVAQEALRHVRASDVLARWGGEEFVLLMSDTRAALARGGVERLQQRVQALRILHGPVALGVTWSAGLAEHHAGEAVVQTLERAERGLRESKSQGRARLAVVP